MIIKHLGVGAAFVKMLSSSDLTYPPPDVLHDVIRVVHNAKWSLIKLRQDRNCSYKELCAPMLDRCRFLLQDVRPSISWESVGLKRLQLLRKPTRWSAVVRRIMREKRQLAAVKGEQQGERPDGTSLS